MKFESPQAGRPVQRQEVFHGIHRELINTAYDKAKRMMDREEVNPEDFSDIYTPEDIQKDLDKTKELAGKFEKTKNENELLHKVSLSAEALIFEQVALAGWLSATGVKVYVEKTSQADDYLNKTDMVLVFVTKEDEEPLSITVDITIGVLSLQEKIHSIKQEIDTKTLGHVKYHENLSGGHESLDGVPRVVLGIEPQEITRLLALWTQETEGSKSRLKKHPVQLALVRQIEEQLISYQKYAHLSQDDVTAEKYETLIHIIQKVRLEKENSALSEEESEDLFRLLGMMRRALQAQLMFPKSRVPEGIVKGNPNAPKHE